MATKYTCAFVFTLFLILNAYGQDTYVYQYNDFANSGSVYELTNNELTLLTELGTTEPKFGDIAVGPNGSLYGITPIGSIRRINLSNGSTTEIVAFSDTTIHTALTCDQSGNFYALDAFTFNLISINLNTQEEETILFLGENTPGDITFYKGHLAYISAEGVIKAIDLNTLEISTIYCIPEEMIDMTALWGINNVFDSCGEEQLLVGNYFNEIYQIDVENDSYIALNATYDMDLGGAIHGMASSNDLLSSQCDGELTNRDCSALGLETFSNSEISIYPNPSNGEIRIDLGNETGEMYLSIYDAMGKLMKVQEIYLNDTFIDLSGFAPGLYFLELQSGNEFSVHRILLK